MPNAEDFIRAIQKEQLKTRSIRRAERDIKARQATLGSQPLINSSDDLEGNLRSVLPKHLQPSNFGSYK